MLLEWLLVLFFVSWFNSSKYRTKVSNVTPWSNALLGVIRNEQLFASSALLGEEADHARLNSNSGWGTQLADVETPEEEWVEVREFKLQKI